MAHDRPRRQSDPMQAAEAAFKKATTKPIEQATKKPVIPGAKEMISIRIDKDVLEHFQSDGPGWEGRINDALRAAASK